MKNHKQTIRKIVGFLNNPEEQGGFWLPNIQRPFVWSEQDSKYRGAYFGGEAYLQPKG